MPNKGNVAPVNQYVFSASQRIISQGHDLVRISTHNTDCPLCKPWEGKILSLTGKTKGYPTLEQARVAGLFHEGCRHAMGLYIDLDNEIKDLEQELKIPQSQRKQTKGFGCGTIIAMLIIIILLFILLLT